MAPGVECRFVGVHRERQSGLRDGWRHRENRFGL